jgi:catechol 2,3-dioxygenase-like lactoylglutathione lyase family enzyme
MGYATFHTPQLDRMIDYYLNVIGLILVSRDAGGAFLAARTGLLAVELLNGPQPDCAALAFEVGSDQEFETMKGRLAAKGIECELRGDPAPGVARSLAFKDYNGTTIQLFKGWEPQGLGRPVCGIGPLKLGHVAFNTADAKAASNFYVEVMGFRISDWLYDMASFLRCNSDHHSANFFQAGAVGVHHIALEVTDFSHMRNACDILVQNGLPVVFGPLRAGPGHNIQAMHLNPDGHVVECYAELDQMKDEALGYFDPRPWHRDHPQRPKVWRVEGGLGWGPPISGTDSNDVR